MFDRLDAFGHDVRYSIRQLLRSPGLTATVILTFALGIGANAAMFGVIDRLLLRPPAHVRAPETIVRLSGGTAERGFNQKTFNYPAFKAIRDRANGFEDVTATADLTVSVGSGEAAQSARGLLASGRYFSLLGVQPRAGRFFGPEDDVEPLGAPVVVISYDFWNSRFGGEMRAVGSVLELGDRKFTVIGVAPKDFTGLDVEGPELWIPFASAGVMMSIGRNWATSSLGSWLTIVARQRAGVPAAQAAADAMRVAREAAPAAFFTGPGWMFRANTVMSTRAADQGVNASVTRLLAAMSVVVLLIACANVANLFLARGLRRRREIAVRLALGISRARLIAHLLTESMLLALAGGIAAAFVAYWGSGLMYRLLFSDLTIHGSLLDPRILGFTAITTVATGLITGLIPALQTSRPELSSALKAGSREGGGQRSAARNWLLIGQTAMSLVLLVGAGLFFRSLINLNAVRLGIDVDRVLVASMNLRAVGRSPAEADAIFDQALERVRRVPGVAYAALAATAPFGSSYADRIAVPGPDSVTHDNAMSNRITLEYFSALGTRVLRGRDFRPSDAAGRAPVAIVNEMFEKHFFGGRAILGQCVHIGADSLPCAEIVGVVENVRRQSIFEDSTNAIYLPAMQDRTGKQLARLIIRAAGAKPAALIGPVRAAIQTAAPQLPFADVHLIADDPTVRRELRPYRLGAAMFGVFGALALVLAVVGMYGVVSYDVGQRTREMGIRIALGATGGSVARLVLREGVYVVAVGSAIGVALCLLGAKFVAPLLYAQPARDPLILAAVTLLLIAVACAACLVPARRAVRTDPLVALRTE